ncbi:MAG: ATP-binding cassette domain-containing protein [Alphaproteobacteria bacterium]|nr:ATP-binding cassette domain-containing protein [Alphaproteobacteria bacterium]
MSLRVKGLSVQRAGRTILHSTDLTVETGERIALVGSSGSGKSTLGHALTDRLGGRDGVVAHVPQSPDEALDPFRTLRFHWREAERALGLPPDLRRQSELLTALGLSQADLTTRPWGWSRGMQQRFVIAMALIGSPKLLILDEPTSALDPVIAAATMELVDRHLVDSGTAMLLITHDLGLAARRAERVWVLEAGRIVEDAATAKLLTRPASAAAKALVAHRNWAVLPC